MASQPMYTNVVRLPTAAARKIKNPAGLALISASQALPQHPAKWEDHGGRKAWAEARFDRSPEMMVITALFSLLPEGAKAEVRKKIGTIADLNASPHAATALHIVESVK